MREREALSWYNNASRTESAEQYFVDGRFTFFLRNRAKNDAISSPISRKNKLFKTEKKKKKWTDWDGQGQDNSFFYHKNPRYSGNV